MAGSGADAHPDTVEELADLLRRDPVVVQQPWGSGDAAGTDARITALLDQAPFDVRVAVVSSPSDAEPGIDASDFLATALARRIGEPGLYVVVADGRPVALTVVDTPWDQTLLSLQRYRDLDAVSDAAGEEVLAPGVQAEVVVRTVVEATPISSGEAATTTSLAPETVRDLAERERELRPFELPDHDDVPPRWGEGARWAAGTTVGVGVLVLLLQSLAGWPGWRRRTPPTTAADPAGVRRGAEQAVTELAQDLSRTTGHRDRTAGERAQLARDAAGLLLGSSDVLDLVGALVLARAGRRELSRRVPGARGTLDGCFFDPRHPGSLEQVEERLGDADLVLTVCGRCARSIASGSEPAALPQPGSGPFARPRPYYEGATVWARTGFGTLSPDLGTFARDVLRDLERRR